MRTVIFILLVSALSFAGDHGRPQNHNGRRNKQHRETTVQSRKPGKTKVSQNVQYRWTTGSNGKRVLQYRKSVYHRRHGYTTYGPWRAKVVLSGHHCHEHATCQPYGLQDLPCCNQKHGNNHRSGLHLEGSVRLPLLPLIPPPPPLLLLPGIRIEGSINLGPQSNNEGHRKSYEVGMRKKEQPVRKQAVSSPKRGPNGRIIHKTVETRTIR